MNALSHLASAQADLIATIDRATAAVSTIAQDALGASLARLQAEALGARQRLANARQALLSSVAGLLADLTSFTKDLVEDLGPDHGEGLKPSPATEAPTEPATEEEAAPVSATVETAIGPCAVTVRELPVPEGLLASLGMKAIGPVDMDAELANATRAVQGAAAAIAGKEADQVEDLEQAVDLAFEEEQRAMGKLFADTTPTHKRRRRKGAA